MVRANFPADFYAACPRFTKESDAASRGDVLAMDVMIAKFREQNIAHHHRFFARRWPARQAEQCAPVTFMHDAIADQIVILTMIERGQVKHPRILHGTPHHLVILNTMTVVSDRDNARLRE